MPRWMHVRERVREVGAHHPVRGGEALPGGEIGTVVDHPDAEAQLHTHPRHGQGDVPGADDDEVGHRAADLHVDLDALRERDEAVLVARIGQRIPRGREPGGVQGGRAQRAVQALSRLRVGDQEGTVPGVGWGRHRHHAGGAGACGRCLEDEGRR